MKPQEEMVNRSSGNAFTSLVARRSIIAIVPLVEGFFRYDLFIIKNVKESSKHIWDRKNTGYYEQQSTNVAEQKY